MIKRFIRKIAGNFGYVPIEYRNRYRKQCKALASKWVTADEERQYLLKRNTELTTELSAATREIAQLNHKLHKSKFANSSAIPHLAELECDAGCRANTHALLGEFISKPISLMDVCLELRFNKQGLWMIYWLMARVNYETSLEAKNLVIEDAISRYWVARLEHHGKRIRDLSGIEIGYDSIHDHRQPAVKEKQVGADILLLIGGKSILPNGGIRAIWIQSKRNTRASGYHLDYLTEKNTDGLQFEALKKVHKPAKGSVGIYVLYSEKLRFLPAIVIDKIPQSIPKDKKPIDLSAEGSRFQELLVAILSQEKMGAFMTTQELLDYITSIGGGAPMNIVTVTDDDRELNLLREVSLHYKQELGIERAIDLEQVFDVKEKGQRERGDEDYEIDF